MIILIMKNEEAGYFYVVEHEDVTKGTIEILKVDKNNITIHWSGTANIFWDSNLERMFHLIQNLLQLYPCKRNIK